MSIKFIAWFTIVFGLLFVASGIFFLWLNTVEITTESTGEIGMGCGGEAPASSPSNTPTDSTGGSEGGNNISLDKSN